jgi:hypothetical protein
MSFDVYFHGFLHGEPEPGSGDRTREIPRGVG